MSSPTPQHDQNTPVDRPVTAIILAAGRATRMKSDLVKVLHLVCDRPMVAWIIDACREIQCQPIHLIVGYQADRVEGAFADQNDLRFVEQKEQLGTGHAVQQAEPLLKDFVGDVIVLGGDGPLIRGSTLKVLLETHRSTGASATLATSVIDDPTGYGRIVRDDQDRFQAIVEEKDTNDEQRAIHEINPSYYCFRGEDLFRTLPQVGCNNANGEFYLTDVLGVLREEGKRIEVVPAVEPEDVLSINTPEQLAEVSALLDQRRRKETTA